MEFRTMAVESLFPDHPPNLADSCHAILDHAPMPMLKVEAATHALSYANHAFCNLLGRPLAELIGKTIEDILPERDECAAMLDRVVATGTPESHTEIEQTDGHRLFWSYTMWPATVGEDRIGVMIQVNETMPFHEKIIAMNEALLLGSLRQHELTEAAEAANIQLQAEIAERKEVEAELRESEARYHNLFNSINNGFCVIEMIFDGQNTPVDYRLLEVNPGFEKQTGIIGGTGKRILELVPNIEAHWLEMYGRVALSGKPVRAAEEFKALNNCWFDVYAFRIGGQGSRKIAVIFNNITESEYDAEHLADGT